MSRDRDDAGDEHAEDFPTRAEVLAVVKKYKPLPKVQAGGIIRVSLDNTWRTPEKILGPVREYWGGEIPFDAATGLDNPTRARAYAVGHMSEEQRDGLAFATARGLALKGGMEPTWNLLARGEASSLIRDGWREAMHALDEGLLPFRSGLAVDWTSMGGTYVNPPYGRELRAWLEKIAEEAEAGAEIVGLLPCARWEQKYFHEALECANAVCFIRSRVAFISSIDGVAVGGNPYASMLVGWNVHEADWWDAFKGLGFCLEVFPMSEDSAIHRREIQASVASGNHHDEDALSSPGEAGEKVVEKVVSEIPSPASPSPDWTETGEPCPECGTLWPPTALSNDRFPGSACDVGECFFADGTMGSYRDSMAEHGGES